MFGFRTYVTAGTAALASALIISTGASAQTALVNGVSLMTGAPPISSFNDVNLGSTPGTQWVTQMPMSLSYQGVNLNISFAGAAGVSQADRGWNPTPGSNFFLSEGNGGSVSFAFSSAQRYFGFAWSSVDNANNIQFYNGDSLLASMNGSEFRTAAGLANNFNSGVYAGFNFSELAFDRVVMSGASGHGFEFGGVTFSSTTPEVAPIPLGSAAGLVAFLGMMGARGQGGRLPQSLLSFASLAPRRQQIQRFA